MYRKIYFSILFFTLAVTQKIYATHAAGADLTYRFISRNGAGDTYEITGTFYRDCGGVAAPNTLPIVISSLSCSYTNSTYTLPRIAGTGLEITLPCISAQTNCTNVNSPIQGFQKFVYRGNVVLPFQCTDWQISYSVLARNCAITTMMQGNPCGQVTPIYIEAKLNNLDFTANISPTFSNDPITTVCLGQNSIFNNGVFELDGDSLSFELIDALEAHNNSIPYIPPFSGTNPLTSNPAAAINNVTGDITMNAQLLEIGVIAIRINEYRNGLLIGSVIRDMQFSVDNCSGNVLPSATGINGSFVFTASTCAGNTLSFYINSDDTNAAQTVTMTWDNGIPGALFTTAGVPHPTGTFSWTPLPQDAREQPYIFTVTVRDDNCPVNAFQTYSFLINVRELSSQGTVTPCTFSLSDGAIDLTVNGSSPPYSFLWSPGGDTTEDLTGVPQGIYTVLITDLNGCQSIDTFIIPVNCAGFSASLQSPYQSNGYNIDCYGNSTGSINAMVTGGNPAYSYDWGNGPISDSAIYNLPAGFYSVMITDQAGCQFTDTITLTEPPPILHSGNVTINICEGSDTILYEPPGYFYQWSTSDTTNATGSISQEGVYSVVITDSFACFVTDSFSVLFYPTIDITLSGPIAFCEGDSIQLNAATGYSYQWSTNETSQTIFISDPGNVFVILTDIHSCVDTSALITVTEFSLPDSPHIVPVTDSLIIINPVPGSYLWYLDGNVTSTTGLFYLYPGDGLYYCILTDSNGCSSISDTILITTVSQNNVSNHFTVNPNPTAGLFTVISDGNNPIEDVQIFNFLGEMVWADQGIQPSIKREVNLSEYPEGVYLVRISSRYSDDLKKIIVHR